ncbi:MAG: 2-oxoglutarate dehydrogenase complex dihydrolipoyllysine-residue succinyltransferase [Chitinophagales bacterium]|nr:2-oxoglutarate dehydrogenase complex dihydrolipoyllysine-residue succinyltransferase [Chitinophagales bacterium]
MKIEIRVPSIGESVTEVTLSSWLVEDGKSVEIDEPLCEFESDKATLELPAEAAGTITRVAKEGEDLKIGDLVCYIDTDGAKKVTAEKSESKVATPEPSVAQQSAKGKDITYATSHPSPAAKKILDEKGIDPSAIKGSGVDGRITKEDAKAVTSDNIATPQLPIAITPKEDISAKNEVIISGTRGERIEKMTRLRKTISRRLVEVKNNTAMLTTFNEVDMSRIMELRKQYKDDFSNEHGINLGFMSFFVKACTLALKRFEAINAYINDDSIIYHDFCDVSIAVSTPKGLVVPVIRNTETLGFAEIEKEIKRLATLGRDGQLSIGDMEGGTFTITNGGVFGSLLSTPIINQPQSAILGMHKIQDRPMVINGQIVIRPMMYLALSYDHRIVDGKESVSFLVAVKDYLENPERMLFEI